MKTALSLVLLCSWAHGAACPAGHMKDAVALVQIEQRWARVLEQHDMPGLDCILAAEFEEAGAAGELMNRSEMLAGAARYRDVHYKLSEMHPHVYGDFGYIRGVGVARSGGKPPVKTRFTDIFVYREGRWQCVAGHESRFPYGAQ